MESLRPRSRRRHVTQREMAAKPADARSKTRRQSECVDWMSRILAASGRLAEGVQAAEMSVRAAPGTPEGLEQQAALYAATGDVRMLELVARDLRRSFPDRPSAPYYAAATEFFQTGSTRRSRSSNMQRSVLLPLRRTQPPRRCPRAARTHRAGADGVPDRARTESARQRDLPECRIARADGRKRPGRR